MRDRPSLHHNAPCQGPISNLPGSGSPLGPRVGAALLIGLTASGPLRLMTPTPGITTTEGIRVKVSWPLDENGLRFCD